MIREYLGASHSLMAEGRRWCLYPWRTFVPQKASTMPRPRRSEVFEK